MFDIGLSGAGYEGSGLQRKFEAHGQRLEQLVHDALGDGADVHAADEVHGLFDLVLRDVVRPQAHGEEHAQLLFQRQRFVAGVCHIPPHDPGGAELHKVEVPLGQLRLIGAEDLVQLPGRLVEDVFRRLLLAAAITSSNG